MKLSPGMLIRTTSPTRVFNDPLVDRAFDFFHPEEVALVLAVHSLGKIMIMWHDRPVWAYNTWIYNADEKQP